MKNHPDSFQTTRTHWVGCSVGPYWSGCSEEDNIEHQWYWSCEYSDFTKLEFDSYIVQEEDQQINTFWLLDTDNRVVLPINSPIRIIVTTTDVLHSWTVPKLGVKTDATPGQLNQVRFSINRPGLLYGQCSEIFFFSFSFSFSFSFLSFISNQKALYNGFL